MQDSVQHPSTEFIHGPIPPFGIALKGIESGYRQCFRFISGDLSQHHRILCETYAFVGINVIDGQSITQIIGDLKSGKTDHDFDYGRYQTIRGDKPKARDTAFKLLDRSLRAKTEDKAIISVKVFNAVLFVMSHPGTFEWNTRCVLRVAYVEGFVISTKQKANLNQ
jgi:hypothetical protein